MQLKGQNENINVMVVALPLSQRAVKVEALSLRRLEDEGPFVLQTADRASAPTLEARAGFEPATYNQSGWFLAASLTLTMSGNTSMVTRTTKQTLTLA